MIQINQSWSFEEALTKLSERYTPGSIIGGPQRNRQIEAWGQIVGRTRALAEFEEAIKRSGSLSAFARTHQISNGTLKRIRNFYEGLHDDNRTLRLYPGRTFGVWRLEYRLGSGGNADVWAARSGKVKAALKILRRVRGKSLQRFRAEVSILEQLNGDPGILPKLDAQLPRPGTAAGDAWLAIPLATPLEKALTQDTPARDIVAGIAQVAKTMARLHGQGIAHRDLKPNNLYVREEFWLIGDFGIASFPGKEALTSGGNKLGPLHFIAPEMLHAPDKSDGKKADVFSLVKSLWVLLSGAKFPPPGEHRRDIEQIRIRNWVDLQNGDVLDELFEQSTWYDPTKRISMREVHEILSAWLERSRA